MTTIDPTRPWTIITGDCMAVLKDMLDGAIDHVIADPPYNERTHGGMMSAKNSKSTHRSTGPTNRPHMIRLDFAPLVDLDGLVREQLRVSRRWVVDHCALEMLGDYERAAGDAWVRAGVWRRRDPAPQFSGDRPGQACDGVAIMHRPGRKEWNGGGSAAFWEVLVVHADRVHATQKEVAGMMRMVEQFTDPGDLVLDTHCGSGTTGVACLRLGRRFLGIEVDTAMAETARERLRAEERMVGVVSSRAGQGALFG